MGEAGIIKMFRDIIKLLQSKKIGLNPDKLLKDAVNNLQPFLEEIFTAKEGAKPVLLLDNAHLISEPDDMATIADLAKKWHKVILILTGDKMDNTFLRDFIEFPLGPWGKQA